MHNHKHCSCNHNIKHCSICDVAYCTICGKEWVQYTYTPYNWGTTGGDWVYCSSPSQCTHTQ